MLGPIAAVAAEAGQAWYNNRMAQSMQHEQMDFQQKSFGSRYQTQVKDLIAAGLNPMLAYGQSPGSGPSGSMPSPSRPDVVGAFNASRIASAQEANIRSDTIKKEAEKKNLDADTLIKTGMPELIAAQVVQSTASAAQSSVMAQKIRAEIDKVSHEIELLKKQSEKTGSDVVVNKSTVEANRYLMGLRAAEIYLNDARSRTVRLEGDILDPKAKQAKTFSAEAGAAADNIGKIGSAAWKFMFPSIGGGK